MSKTAMDKIWTEVSDESTDVPVKVTGTLPPWLQGTLVRNGPVRVSIDGQSPAHWFDGLGMLHAFSFDRGNVRYSNKFLRTDAYRTVFDDGSIDYVGFVSDPCRSLFKRFLTYLLPHAAPLNNTNVHVDQYAGAYVALTEIPLPIRFDKETLDTLGVLDYADELPKERCFESAHPHHAPGTKEVINYIVDYSRRSHYIIYRIADGTAGREVIAKLPVDTPAYMHSFAVTDRYVVLVEYPMVVSPFDMMTGRGFIQNYRWKPELGTHFRVVSRVNGKEIGRYKTEAFFAFHHVNAYEAGSNIILDIVTYPDASIILDIGDYGERQSRVDEDARGIRLQRFTVAMPEGKISADTIAGVSMEFPRINEALDGKPYQYAYLVDARDPQAPEDIRSLYKVDMNSKALTTWAEAGCYPGEPVFVSSPQGATEDDGVVLTIVMQPDKNSSFLLVLDARSMQELGRVTAPYFIPAGLHARFFGSSSTSVTHGRSL